MLVNGVEICVETFGDPTDPAILLIAGSGASMDWCEDAFCARLQAGGRYVIRYDHRDTGQSVTYAPGAPAYTGDDLVDDVAGVIAALELPSAHLVGLSMGGAIAQLVGLDHRDRVESLTLISTTAAVPTGADAELPGMADRLRDAFAIPMPDLSDRRALLDHLTELNRAFAGTTRPFDAAGTRALWERVLDRTANVESTLVNHDAIESDDRRREPLATLDVPTLVIHGTEDPLFPFEHGVALARAIPDAELLTLDATGHELPRETWDVVVPAILRRSSAARTEPGRS
jgi:pimeloyl-ACP methyl ester carboxylesterase